MLSPNLLSELVTVPSVPDLIVPDLILPSGIKNADRLISKDRMEIQPFAIGK